jgi:uncharacterized protein (DUF1778 family)
MGNGRAATTTARATGERRGRVQRPISISTTATLDEGRTIEMAAAAVGHSVAGYVRWAALRTAAAIRAETVVRG